MAAKKELASTNVRPIVKKFLRSFKDNLGERLGKFMSEGNTLMYYLEGNPQFVRDFEEWKITKKLAEDPLSVLTQQ